MHGKNARKFKLTRTQARRYSHKLPDWEEQKMALWLLPRTAIDEILRLAHVPPHRRLVVSIGIQQTVVGALRHHKISQLRLHGRNVRKPLRQIANAAHELAEVFVHLECEPRELLRTVIQARHSSAILKFVRPRPSGYLPIFIELASLFRDLAKSATAAPFARPLGRLRTDALRYLVYGLHISIVVWGGKLTLSKRVSDGQLSGTLPAILSVLRDYIPQVIPRKLAYSTLQRRLGNERQIEAAVAQARRQQMRELAAQKIAISAELAKFDQLTEWKLDKALTALDIERLEQIAVKVEHFRAGRTENA